MPQLATMLRRGAAETRARKASAEARMAVRDGAKAALHGAAELAQSARDELRDSRAAERAAELTREGSDRAMRRVAELLDNPAVAQRLGIQRRRRRAGIAGALLGLAVGLIAGMLVARREDAGSPTGAPENLAPPLGRGQVDLDAPHGLEQAVRRELAGDPRTSVLSDLVVNVAEGTAFVRGSVPPNVDERVIGEVVRAVDGIAEADVQVTVST